MQELVTGDISKKNRLLTKTACKVKLGELAGFPA